MAATRFKSSIRKDGPFFRGDPAKTVRENAHDLMVAVAKVGADDVRGQIQAGERGRRPVAATGGRISHYVRGELRRAPAGPRYSAAVFVETRGYSATEATSIMAAASSIEARVHAFRKTSGRISRARGVNLDEMLKGIQ